MQQQLHPAFQLVKKVQVQVELRLQAVGTSTTHSLVQVTSLLLEQGYLKYYLLAAVVPEAVILKAEAAVVPGL
jgi:hypothetical protein